MNNANVLAWIDDGPEYLKLAIYGDEVHHADLRDCAYNWHGGQWSPLYAFASSGAIVEGLAREANDCLALAHKQEAAEHYESPVEGYDDSLLLATIVAVARSHGDES